MLQSAGDQACHLVQEKGFLHYYSTVEGTLQYLEVQAPCNADATREPWTIHFLSEHPDLLAFVTCTVSPSSAQYQLEASASTSGEQTSHTYSHQL